MGSRRKLQRSLPCDQRAPYLARRSLSLLNPALPEETHETVELLLTELVTNSVRHSCTPSHATIDMNIEADEGLVRAEVTDHGTGEIPPPDPGASTLDTGGRGLFLVDALSDRWGVKHAPQNTVWFEVRAG